jgi:uncharacterized tellurite resistance protein B-like protein
VAKKSISNVGVGVLVVLAFVVALVTSIPKETWIAIGMVVVAGMVAYLSRQSKKAQSANNKQKPLRPEPPPSALTAPSSRRAVSQRVVRYVEDDTPVSTVTRTATEPDFKIPPAPKGFGAGTWVLPGHSVTVAGAIIPGGMVYVGTSLSTPSEWNDPCLIDPSKSVATRGDCTERLMGYWPSYSTISAEARRAYLNWLASGRSNPAADIGYVFLFFYGLERRAIVDAAKDVVAQADWAAIAAELRSLLAIYGDKSGSFRGYASALLDWVSLAEHPSRLYEKPIPSFPRNYELPLYLRLALGQAAVDGVPVPAHLALAWARLEPNIFLRTPATRCATEFERLFEIKYAEMCDRGMVLPRNRTKLKLVYRPASAGLRGYQELTLTFKDTPDVTVLTAPLKTLREVIEAATKPLESYSRFVSKNPDVKLSLEGLLQLPATLWPESAQESIQSLKTRIGEGMVAMPFQELLANLGAKAAFTKDRTLGLARALESANVGFEPDVLSGAKPPKAEDPVVLFALPPSEPVSRASGPYLAAAVTLQLASAVASADGDFTTKEVNHLRETVLSWKHLTPSQTRRLLAHLRLLMQAPASLTTLKKKFEPLDLAVKETIAAFMAAVAQADNDVSPAEVKMLEKIYKALGVDPKRVFSDVHAVAASTKSTAATRAKAEQSGFKLDPARIAELQKDTEKVSALLANIFLEADEPTAVGAPVADVASDAEAVEPAAGLLDLDEIHTALARMLLSRPEWSREELMDVAADMELMLDGALEHINEAAFDTHDMPFFEGEGPMTVNPEILEKVGA